MVKVVNIVRRDPWYVRLGSTVWPTPALQFSGRVHLDPYLPLPAIS